MRLLIVSVKDTFFLLPMWKSIISARPQDRFFMLTIGQNWIDRECFLHKAKRSRILTALFLFLAHYGLLATFKKIFFNLLKKSTFMRLDLEKRHYANMCLKNNVRYRDASEAATDSILAVAKEFKPDVILYQAPLKLEKDILSAAPLGVISRHPSILPEFKGCFPLFWALAQGEKTAGVTIYRLNENLDGGRILIQERFSTLYYSSLRSIYKHSFDIGANLFLKALDGLASGVPFEPARPNIEPSYFGWPGLISTFKYLPLCFKNHATSPSLVNKSIDTITIKQTLWFLQSVTSELISILSRINFYKNIRKNYSFLIRERSILGLNKKSYSPDVLVLVGGGVLPYTALFYRRDFEKIIVLENRKWIIKLMPVALLKRYGHITIIWRDGANFDYPQNSLVIISLLTHGKDRIVEKIRRSAKNATICIREPLISTYGRYEKFSGRTESCPSLESPEFGLKSMRLS